MDIYMDYIKMEDEEDQGYGLLYLILLLQV